MGNKKFFFRWEDLPFALDEDMWGELDEAEEECPGVYYVCTKQGEESILNREFYVVTKEATPAIISPEVVAYGVACGGVWFFEYSAPTDIFNLVKFEIMRYKVKHGIPFDEAEGTIFCSATYFAEYFPWYFGGTIPPRSTPFGLTIRLKKAEEGLFFLETDQCKWLLAVSNPIWSTELSDYAKSLGVFCKEDLLNKVEEYRYLFFTRERCAPAVYELLYHSGHEGLLPFIKSKLVLETHLWEHFPRYALCHNAQEITGNGGADMLDNLMKSLGAELPESDEYIAARDAQRVENCISYAKELVGQELLLLPE